MSAIRELWLPRIALLPGVTAATGKHAGSVFLQPASGRFSVTLTTARLEHSVFVGGLCRLLPCRSFRRDTVSARPSSIPDFSLYSPQRDGLADVSHSGLRGDLGEPHN